MLTYHGDIKVKQKYSERYAAHRAADEVIQGMGFCDNHGCFIGCTLDGYEPRRFEIELGWPMWLVNLVEYIFENLPAHEATQFGTDLHEAMPVGVDLDRLKYVLAIERHSKQLELLGGVNAPYVSETRAVLDMTIQHFKDILDNKFYSSQSQAIDNPLVEVKRLLQLVDEFGNSCSMTIYNVLVSMRFSLEQDSLHHAACCVIRSRGARVGKGAQNELCRERDYLLATLRAMHPA